MFLFVSKAEAEELAGRVAHLTGENVALKAEINRLVEDSDILRRENAKLMVSFPHPFCRPSFPCDRQNCWVLLWWCALQEKLKHSDAEGAGGEGSDTEADETLPMTTENLLSRVDNTSSGETSTEPEEEARDQKVQKLNPGSELRQLLATKPRADAVAATWPAAPFSNS